MEAAAPPVTTGSKTIADLCRGLRSIHGDHAFARHKVGDEWRDVSYAQRGEIIREIGLGLIDLGVQRGDRVCILRNTRPEWTFADFGDRDRRRPSWCRSTRPTRRRSASGWPATPRPSRSSARTPRRSRRSSRSATTCPNLGTSS